MAYFGYGNVQGGRQNQGVSYGEKNPQCGPGTNPQLGDLGALTPTTLSIFANTCNEFRCHVKSSLFSAEAFSQLSFLFYGYGDNNGSVCQLIKLQCNHLISLSDLHPLLITIISLSGCDNHGLYFLILCVAVSLTKKSWIYWNFRNYE